MVIATNRSPSSTSACAPVMESHRWTSTLRARGINLSAAPVETKRPKMTSRVSARNAVTPAARAVIHGELPASWGIAPVVSPMRTATASSTSNRMPPMVMPRRMRLGTACRGGRPSSRGHRRPPPSSQQHRPSPRSVERAGAGLVHRSRNRARPRWRDRGQLVGGGGHHVCVAVAARVRDCARCIRMTTARARNEPGRFSPGVGGPALQRRGPGMECALQLPLPPPPRCVLRGCAN